MQQSHSKKTKPIALKVRLPLRVRPKESSTTVLNPTVIQTKVKPKVALSKSLILGHSMFWKQQNTHLNQIKSLILSDLELNSFEPLDFNLYELSNIELLSLSKNQIISLQPLADLESLIELNLNNNQVFDITPLSFLDKLESVYLNNNRVSDPFPLYNLVNLKNVYLYNNLIPYRERERMIGFGQRLVEFDIEKNEVFKDQEKEQWIKGKLRKFNGQSVSVKMKNQIQMGSTSQSFRPFSSFIDSRPSTARPSTANALTGSAMPDLQVQAQQAQHLYLKLDNQYEDEIVTNVKLKTQLQHKLQTKKVADSNNQRRTDKLNQIQLLKSQISKLLPQIFDQSNPRLKQLYQLTVRYELQKIAQPSTTPVQSSQHPKPTQSKETFEQRPFHADQQLVFEDSEQSVKEFDNSDDQLEEMLRRNDKELNLLTAQLNSLK